MAGKTRVLSLMAISAVSGLMCGAAACSGTSSGGGSSRPTATSAAPTTAAPRQFKPGGTIRRATSEPDSIDPALIDETDGFAIGRLLFTGLVDYDADLHVVPAVAKSWEISPDHLTYTFHLRTDAKFTNGRTVTAEDFAFAARRWVDPDLASPTVTALPVTGWKEAQKAKPSGKVGDGALPGFTATAPDTLVVKLDSPYSLLLDDLATLYPIPAEAVDTPAKAKAFADRPIGNGRYRLVAPWKHNSSIILQRDPAYFGTAGLADRIEFRIFANDVTPYREVEAGNLDIAAPPNAQIAQAKQEFGKRFFQSPAAFLYYIGFPAQKKPYDDVKLRKAVSLAIDREALTSRLLDGASVAADRFVPPGFSGAAGQPCRYVSYDPTMAKRLYEQSGGFPGDAVTAYYPSGQGLDELAKAIANDLRSVLGVNLTFKQVELSQYVSLLFGNPDGPFGSGWSSGLPSAYGFIQPLFESTGSFNVGKFKDPRFEALMVKARGAADQAALDKTLEAAQAVLCDDMPAIPLAFPGTLLVRSERVDNIVVDGFGTTLLERVAVVKP